MLITVCIVYICLPKLRIFHKRSTMIIKNCFQIGVLCKLCVDFCGL